MGSVFAMMLLAVLAGCSPALQLKQVWEDDEYRNGRPQKVLVVCDMVTPTMKRAFENEFVKFLRHQNMEAVESFRIVPEGALNENGGREAAVALIREQGFDAVLFTRTMTGRSETRDIPGMTIVSGFGYSPYGMAASVSRPRSEGPPNRRRRDTLMNRTT